MATYVILRLPGIHVPLDRDEGAFGYMGQLINDGRLPYRDGVDHKPPVAFYINALALHLVPPTEWGIHLFLLLYNLLTLVCLFYLAKIYFQSLSAGLWCAFCYGVFSASPAIQGFTASTEMWMLLPITLSLLLAVLARGRGHSVLLSLSGVAGAAACWTKQSAFTSVLFIFLFVGFTALYPNSDSKATPRAAIRALSFWLLGGGLFSALLMLYFYVQGIFSEFIYWSFLHNLSYTGQLSLKTSLVMVWPRLIEIARGDFIPVAAGVVVAVWGLARKQKGACFILGFLLLSLAGTIPGFGYRHYFAQLAPAMAIAGGYGLSILMGRFRTRNGRLAAAAACGILILAAPIWVNRHYFFERDPNIISRNYFGHNPFPESKLLASYIAGATEPTDAVLVIGSEPQILFRARRWSSSSFVMFYPLMSRGYPRHKEFQETVWNEVQRTPPKYILAMAYIPTSFLWDGVADIDIAKRFDELMKSDYSLEKIMLVTGSQGEWIAANDSRLQPGVGSIYVYRSRK